MNILDFISRMNIPVVEVHPRFESASALLEFVRPLEDLEGFIVDFDGHKVKAKAELYVAMHRIKDDIRAERYIAKLILGEVLDDKIPLMDEADLAAVRAFEVRFDAAIENVLTRLEGLVTLARVLHGGVKKEVAINFVPNLKNKEDASFIFSALDGKDVRELVLKKVLQATGNGTAFEAAMNWMEA
jgi:hypothetical protein